MSDYTILNLGDVENVAPKFGMPEGSGRVKLNDEVRDLRRWDILRVGAGTMRNFESGPEGMTLIAFGSPLGDQNDGEIVPDWWAD